MQFFVDSLRSFRQEANQLAQEGDILNRFLYVALTALFLSLSWMFPSLTVAMPLPQARIVNGQTAWPDLPLPQQAVLLKHLKTYLLGRPHTFYLAKNDPVFEHVSPGVVELLYKTSTKGTYANCFYTSILSSGAVALPERFMSIEEYVGWLENKNYFLRLPAGEPWQTGDVLRFHHARGNVDIHGAVYLGKSGGSRLLITKNGSERNPYMIMSLEELTRFVYYGARIAGVYRPVHRP